MGDFYLEDFMPGGYWWQNTVAFSIALVVFLVSLALKYLQYREIWRLEDMLEDYPEYADLRCKLGELYLQKGRLDRAIEYYLEAVRIYPMFTKARLRLAELYEVFRKPEAAVEQYRVLLKNIPEDQERLRREIERKLRSVSI